MLQFMIFFHTKPTVSVCQPYEAMTSVVKLFDCGCENCLFTITCTAKLKGLILLPKLIKTQNFGKIFLNFCDLPSGHVLGLPSVSIVFFQPVLRMKVKAFSWEMSPTPPVCQQLSMGCDWESREDFFRPIF